MWSDVVRYVTTCETCRAAAQSTSASTNTASVAASEVPDDWEALLDAPKKFERQQVAWVDLPQAPNGFEGGFLFRDVTTGWYTFVPHKRDTSLNLLMAVRKLMRVVDAPQVLELANDYGDRNETKHLLASVATIEFAFDADLARSGGLLLKRKLGMVLNRVKHRRAWTDVLPEAMRRMNSAYSEKLRATPFMRLCGTIPHVEAALAARRRNRPTALQRPAPAGTFSFEAIDGTLDWLNGTVGVGFARSVARADAPVSVRATTSSDARRSDDGASSEHRQQQQQQQQQHQTSKLPFGFTDHGDGAFLQQAGGARVNVDANWLRVGARVGLLMHRGTFSGPYDIVALSDSNETAILKYCSLGGAIGRV
jgi:hypothetical protein